MSSIISINQSQHLFWYWRTKLYPANINLDVHLEILQIPSGSGATTLIKGHYVSFNKGPENLDQGERCQ
jgi:hypothetical protein